MFAEEYVKPELLILIPVLYIIGVALKKSILSDKWIPIVLGVISITLCFIWISTHNTISSLAKFGIVFFTSVTQGVLLVGASVYANQVYKQMSK